MSASESAYWEFRRTAGHDQFRRARDGLIETRTDLAAARAAFRWPRPTQFNWALEWFDVIADDNRQAALEIYSPNGRAQIFSFPYLARRSDAVALWLSSLGVRRHERLLLVLDNVVAQWEMVLACLKLGVVVVASHTSVTRTEAQHRVSSASIDHVVCGPPNTDLFREAETQLRICVGERVAGWCDFDDSRDWDGRRYLPEAATRAADLAFCYFTSGTTSQPRLVGHTHRSYPLGHLSSVYWNGLLPGDRHLNVSAAGWAKHAWSSLFVPWSSEATLLVPGHDVSVVELPRLLATARADSFCAPASVWARLGGVLDTAAVRLREATSAGEPLDPTLAEKVKRAWGVDIREGYGQSETTALAGTPPGYPTRPGVVGPPLPGYDLTIRGVEGGGVCGPGQIGEVCVDLTEDPVGIMVGYLGEAGARHGRPDRHFPTGDLGQWESDGSLRLLGRSDDVFKSFDHRISPYELERVLLTHHDVAAAAVVPRPHPVGGSVPHAVVVPQPWALSDPQQLVSRLLAHCASHLSPMLRVRSIELAEALPRTVTGKIQRSRLAPAPDS